jgi:hypothetical protein
VSVCLPCRNVWRGRSQSAPERDNKRGREREIKRRESERRMRREREAASPSQPRLGSGEEERMLNKDGVVDDGEVP